MAERQIIVRRKKPKVTYIQNSIIWAPGLSNMACLSLIRMLSLPEDWDYSVRGMAVKMGVSKDSMHKYITELEGAGYLLRQRNTAGGQFEKSTYILTDTPFDFGDPCPEAPGTDCPKIYDSDCPNFSDTACPKFSAPKNSPQKKRTKQESTLEPPYNPPTGGRRRNRGPRDAPDWEPERFDGLWKFYPKEGRKAKQRAMDAWDKLAPPPELIDRIALSLVELKATPEWQRGIGIPHVATFLNGRRWEDADELPEPGGGVGRGGDGGSNARVIEEEGTYTIWPT